MLVTDGAVLDRWGEIERKFSTHSIRKSFLSALYGVFWREGKIDVTKTLAELGIDDNEPSLTEIEKRATVHDLLKARSGVYHPALAETTNMAAAKPERHSREPGTFWYYNNWDFNALGTIFNQMTGSDLFVEFERRIAEPIGMEDFDRQSDTRYQRGRQSIHPAYPFQMTARDMARFGLLMLREGRWAGEQIVPSQWVHESSTPYSRAISHNDGTDVGGYGYMWWIAVGGNHYPGVSLPDGTFSARGVGGHAIVVIPALDLVVVHRVNTSAGGNAVSGAEMGELLRIILDAKK
jgi:CubicO group peptidase (beta-lactamase class C family)